MSSSDSVHFIVRIILESELNGGMPVELREE